MAHYKNTGPFRRQIGSIKQELKEWKGITEGPPFFVHGTLRLTLYLSWKRRVIIKNNTDIQCSVQTSSTKCSELYTTCSETNFRRPTQFLELLSWRRIVQFYRTHVWKYKQICFCHGFCFNCKLCQLLFNEIISVIVVNHSN